MSPNQPIQLTWSNAPSETVEFVLIMDDTYCINVQGSACRHWSVFNIPSTVTDANNISSYYSGINWDNSSAGYEGPCPPDGTGLHIYNITIYALNSNLNINYGNWLPENSTNEGFARNYSSQIIGSSTISFRAASL